METGRLHITRPIGSRVMIGDLTITFMHYDHQGVHLLIEAPKDVIISRAELVPGTPEYEARQQRDAAKTTQGGTELR